jgi:hypothetical protein
MLHHWLHVKARLVAVTEDIVALPKPQSPEPHAPQNPSHLRQGHAREACGNA